MGKELLLKIAKGLAITLIVAFIISLFLTSFNFPFLYSFILFIGIQFLFFYFYGEYNLRKNSKIRLDAELKLAQERARQTTDVLCPCDRAIISPVVIDLSKPVNKYICPGCNKNISVFSEFKTALSTEPISVEEINIQMVQNN